jgi:predicted transposase YbfD/YdcC
LRFDDLHQSRFRTYPHDHAKTVDNNHGRIEMCHAWTIAAPNLIRCLRGAENWSHLRTVVNVHAARRLGPEVAVEGRYFISSCAHLDAKHLLHAVRTRWTIENSLPWVVDIAFREDESRLRNDHSAHNVAIVRRIALSLLKQDASARAGVQNRRLRAGWDQNDLLRIISPLFA